MEKLWNTLSGKLIKLWAWSNGKPTEAQKLQVMNTDCTSNSSRKRGGYYSLESGNVSHMCPAFHSICTYKHTLYKYFPTRGPISC